MCLKILDAFCTNCNVYFLIFLSKCKHDFSNNQPTDNTTTITSQKNIPLLIIPTDPNIYEIHELKCTILHCGTIPHHPLQKVCIDNTTPYYIKSQKPLSMVRIILLQILQHNILPITLEGQDDHCSIKQTHGSLLGRTVIAWTAIRTAKFAVVGIGVRFSDGGAFVLGVNGVDGGAPDKDWLLICGD